MTNKIHSLKASLERAISLSQAICEHCRQSDRADEMVKMHSLFLASKVEELCYYLEELEQDSFSLSL